MKFSLFAHMERISADQQHTRLYEDFIHLCKMADAGGMRAIWTGEHHGMDFTIAPNPFLNIIDLAHHTQNVKLGTGTIVAPFWHPIKLAGEAAMTDLVTGGRLEMGLARGAYSYEYERMIPGMDAWQAGQRLREIVPMLPELWAGDYAHEGEFYNFPATSSAPKPVQAGGPPLWIAARDPNSHEFAVKSGCHVQVTPLWLGMAEVESLMERFKTACETVKPTHSPKIMLLHHCYVGADENDLEQAISDLHRFYGYFGAWFKNERPVSQGLIKALTQDEIDANPMITRTSLRENMTLGTVDDVVERIKRYEDLGYDEFSYWIDSGMSFERKRDSLARFINDVMPHFS